tara:strand:+ start:384 stop:1238 length:855 start_codon:yes stop_codon:yes gene_type:complete
MIRPIERKSMKIRPSGRSSDFISPSFGFGCLLECSYCYMKRHKPNGLDYATNIDEILDTILTHSRNVKIEKPNQTHSKYITYDIACNEDFALHNKYYDWEKIFTFFVTNPHLMGTFATKIIPTPFLSYNPDEKIRIRFSLMPQSLSSKLEPKTTSIKDRIKAVNTFRKAGYDVHLNFSPVLFYDGWRKDYEELFNIIDKYVDDKDNVLAEVIFLTHNKKKHNKNIEYGVPHEDLLWQPKYQEAKESQYGSKNIRYKWEMKSKMINVFKKMHKNIIPWNTIRYIF